jgi:hypothetical protein
MLARLLSVAFACCAFLFVATGAHANACCQAQNAKCESFCRSPAGQAQGQACWNACGSRVAACLESGVYVWRNSPNVTCSEKKGPGGGCAAGQITCARWCEKYRGNSEACLRTHPQGCMLKYGSLNHCVGDLPPSR